MPLYTHAYGIDWMWILPYLDVCVWWKSMMPHHTNSIVRKICLSLTLQHLLHSFALSLSHSVCKAEIYILDTNVSVWNANYVVLHCFLNQMHWSTNRGQLCVFVATERQCESIYAHKFLLHMKHSFFILLPRCRTFGSCDWLLALQQTHTHTHT